MNRLQFATLISWAGDSGLQGRKRLQKIVFFLQQAGCDLECHYSLHHFGPYSRDVAAICDEMVVAGLVEECGGGPYEYKLAPQTKSLLERTPESPMTAFRKRGEELIGENIWTLELGSTILFYFRQHDDWDISMRLACKFKKVNAEDEPSQKALSFAKQYVSSAATN